MKCFLFSCALLSILIFSQVLYANSNALKHHQTRSRVPSFFGRRHLSFLNAGANGAREQRAKSGSGETRVADATARFAFLFLNNLGFTTGNVIFSPFSLQMLLSMLYLGARNESEAELKSALGYRSIGLNGDEPHAAMKHLLSNLRTELKSASGKGYTLELANAVWIQNGFNVLKEYKDKLNDFYDTETQEVDFQTHGQIVQQRVNNWVQWKTSNMITSLLEEPLSTNTRLFLTNAVFFKGTWLYKFDKQFTLDLNFYNEGRKDRPKLVPFMSQTLKIPFANINELNAKAIELPYSGSDVSMLILLPHERDGLSKLEKTLTASTLRAIYSRLSRKDVAVHLPKFRLEQNFDLRLFLERLGVKSIFDESKANLAGIDGVGNLYVSKALHKSAIEVNEEGTKASAVSAAATSVRTSSIRLEYFSAEHPFLFIIRDKKSGLILFLGRVSSF